LAQIAGLVGALLLAGALPALANQPEGPSFQSALDDFALDLKAQGQKLMEAADEPSGTGGGVLPGSRAT
jgi:hypothetical protein